VPCKAKAAMLAATLLAEAGEGASASTRAARTLRETLCHALI
jgi:hypothetical protein